MISNISAHEKMVINWNANGIVKLCNMRWVIETTKYSMKAIEKVWPYSVSILNTRYILVNMTLSNDNDDVDNYINNDNSDDDVDP